MPTFFQSIMGVIRVFDEASGAYRDTFAPEVSECERDMARLRTKTEALMRDRQRLAQHVARLEAAPPPPPSPSLERPVGPDDPYFILGVHEVAPDYVIKAAYKAAAKRVHSDAGGTDKEMSRLNRAMDDIARRRGWTNT